MSKDDKNKVNTTGHQWDGIEEFNNPLPRWWVWVFYACIVWGIGYSIAYPAWPLFKGATPGLIGFSTRGEVVADIEKFKAMNSEVEAQLASADLTTLTDNAGVYNYAIQSGRATFATYCSQCHGSGAAGAKGYPNLLDNDWIWGGDIESIAYTIRHGIRNTEDEDNARYSQMPAFGDDILEAADIDNVVAYVRSLSGLESEMGDVTAGATVFAENCVACHGENGKGSLANGIEDTGAPNLADAIWLYGSKFDEVKLSVQVGPFGAMPAWGKNPLFDDAKINAVAAYVHQLGGGE